MNFGLGIFNSLTDALKALVAVFLAIVGVLAFLVMVVALVVVAPRRRVLAKGEPWI